MVRQLAYDFRDWNKIEALGRLGADEGIDILAEEKSLSSAATTDDEESPLEGEESRSSVLSPGRVWIIQCKREKKIGPTKLVQIVRDALVGISPIPYGLIIAAACDFSKAARDKARDEAAVRGLEEVHFWGKAELEDMIVQPKNDHLLFAYFNISLQTRRRSVRADVRGRLATKRRLVKVFGDINRVHATAVFIRNANVASYPTIEDPAAFALKPQWGFYDLAGHWRPDHLVFAARRFHARLDDSRTKWDAVFEFDETNHPSYLSVVGVPGPPELDPALEERRRRVTLYWFNLPEELRAWYVEAVSIHYDRIVAVDEIGDVYHPGVPHLLVDYTLDGKPFERRKGIIQGWAHGEFGPLMQASDETRAELFPKDFPEVVLDDETVRLPGDVL